MDLKPDKKTISEIFPLETNVTYNIPIYQRNYSWKEENIEVLIQDIIQQKSGYYLGNFIVTEYPDNQNYFDIVDGQQRLTTIALILLSIYEILQKSVDSKILDDDILRKVHSTQDRIKEKLLKTDDTPQLSLLDPDKAIYIDLLHLIIKRDENAKPHKNKIFGRRYDYTKNYLETFFFDKEENRNDLKVKEGTEKILDFYSKLNYAEILRIRVPNLNDAFTVFTSFNAKGVPLTLIDLFKSFYLREADGKLSQDEALSKWEELISIFYNDNDEPISSVITRFLLNNYDTFESTKKASITSDSALDVYDKLFHSKGYKYIDVLIDRARIFSNIIGKIETVDVLKLDKQAQKKLLYLDKLESTQIYPILFYLLNKYHDNKITLDLINDYLDFLLTYYVRRNIILKPKASNIRAKAIQCVRELSEKDIVALNDINNCKDNLMLISASDEEFKVALNGPVYSLSKNTTRIILIYLERKYGSLFNKQTPDNLDNVTDKGNYVWSLEHIMPQSAFNNRDWKPELLKVSNSEEEAKIILEKNVHRLGNLTLTGYNSEMSAKTFIEKRDYRDKSSNNETGLKTKLHLNESIANPNESIQDKEEWSIEDIDRRTEKLIEETSAIFTI